MADARSSGLGVTLRDYGRFGLLVADDGRIGGKSILPANWFADAGVPRVMGGHTVDYGYMGWIPPGQMPCTQNQPLMMRLCSLVTASSDDRMAPSCQPESPRET